MVCLLLVVFVGVAVVVHLSESGAKAERERSESGAISRTLSRETLHTMERQGWVWPSFCTPYTACPPEVVYTPRAPRRFVNHRVMLTALGNASTSTTRMLWAFGGAVVTVLQGVEARRT